LFFRGVIPGVFAGDVLKESFAPFAFVFSGFVGVPWIGERRFDTLVVG
jgi:hypothetical protein